MDTLLQDSVIRNIEVIGEGVKNLSKEIKEKYSEIPWKDISGMRDKSIHFYFGVDIEIVWEVIKNDNPNLYEEIEKIMKTYEKESEEGQKDMEIET